MQRKGIEEYVYSAWWFRKINIVAKKIQIQIVMRHINALSSVFFLSILSKVLNNFLITYSWEGQKVSSC